VFELGVQLLDMLEVIHSAGYIYNQLCVDQLILGDKQRIKPETRVKDISLHLGGFECVTPFRDFRTGEHLPPSTTKKVNIGNVFASYNQLQFKRTSRVDDLESLCLVLIYLMQDPVKIPDLHFPKATMHNDRARLIFLQSFKKSFTPEKLCQKSKANML
jgi:hypothetical protein